MKSSSMEKSDGDCSFKEHGTGKVLSKGTVMSNFIMSGFFWANSCFHPFSLLSDTALKS